MKDTIWTKALEKFVEEVNDNVVEELYKLEKELANKTDKQNLAIFSMQRILRFDIDTIMSRMNVLENRFKEKLKDISDILLLFTKEIEKFKEEKRKNDKRYKLHIIILYISFIGYVFYDKYDNIIFILSMFLD